MTDATLTEAGVAIPRHDWDYGYGAVAACGTTNPGLNNNRTTMSDSKAGGTPTTTTYCYDNADRIVSSATTNAPSGANAVVDGLAASELGMRRTGLTTLAPTDSTVCTAAYTVVPGDASASRISNTAEAVASSPRWALP